MPLQYSCDKLELEPKQAIMVGDSCNDIEAGFSAGTYVVLFLTDTNMDNQLNLIK